MRISDWSSDVCSSDLGQRQVMAVQPIARKVNDKSGLSQPLFNVIARLDFVFNEKQFHGCLPQVLGRGDRKSVAEGKSVSVRCRSRWSPYHSQKKTRTTHNRTIQYVETTKPNPT